MMKKLAVSAVLALGLNLLLAGYSFGGSETVPKGVLRISVFYTEMLPTDERFDPSGNVENPGVDFSGLLNSFIFPQLGLVEQAFSMPPGSGSIGTSIVSFEKKTRELSFTLDYGITDRLQAVVVFPYVWAENKVDARLDSSTATIGKNEAFSTLAPLAGPLPGTVPLTKEDVINLLGPGLQVGSAFFPGLGFKRFETWTGEGIGDIEAGFRYQVLKKEDWRFLASAGFRFPTGETDDPNDFVDLSLGAGAPALLFRLSGDYLGINKVTLSGAVKYDLYLPDKELKRVPDSVNRPVTMNPPIYVDRNLGDIVSLVGSVGYAFTDALDASVSYLYAFKGKDKASGPAGFNYQSLEDETDWKEHVFGIGLSYDTTPLYVKKKFPIPVSLSLGYSNLFKGENNVMKAEYLSFGAQVMF